MGTYETIFFDAALYRRLHSIGAFYTFIILLTYQINTHTIFQIIQLNNNIYNYKSRNKEILYIYYIKLYFFKLNIISIKNIFKNRRDIVVFY